MGYYSDYNLLEPCEGDILYELCDKYNGENYVGNLFSERYINGKWYECEKDMKRISLEEKNVRFVIEVSGQEDGDLWRLYAINGKTKVYNAKVIYEDDGLSEQEKWSMDT